MRAGIIARALALALGVSACGGEGADGRLSVAERRLSLVPALDVTALPELGANERDTRARLVIDEVVAGVADVRVRGGDETAGLSLLRAARLVSSRAAGSGLVLPAEAAREALAIQVRLERTALLDGASVVVRGRLFAGPLPVMQKLSVQSEEPDPDGEPADPSRSKALPGKRGKPRGGLDLLEPAPMAADEADPAAADEADEPDPDGEPAAPKAMGGSDCEPDPDGEPAGPCAGRALLRSSASYVAFELHGSDAVDLLVDARDAAAIEVVVGVPAEQWLTPIILRQLQDELMRRLGSGAQEGIAGSVVVLPVGTRGASAPAARNAGYRVEAREREVAEPVGE